MNDTWNLQFSLESGGAIVGQDTREFDALALHRTNLAQPHSRHVYWLDADLALVRSDDLCDRYDDGRCTTAAIDWEAAGLTAFLPLDLARRVVENETAVFATRYGPVDVPTEVHERKGVRTFDLVRQAGSPYSDGFPRSATFAPDSAAPVEVLHEGSARTLHLERLSIETGNPIALPSYRVQSPPLTAADPDAEERLFPGEHDDPFGLGWSHLYLFEHALGDSDDLQNAANQGCLRRYALAPAPPASSPVDPVQDELEKRVATLEIAFADDANAPQQWEAKVFDGVQGLRMEIEGPKERSGAPGCPRSPHDGRPNVDATSFLHDAQVLIGERHPLLQFAFERRPSFQFPSESTPWNRYSVLFQPEWTQAEAGTVGFKPLSLVIEADNGLLERAIIDAEDYAAWQPTS